MVLLRILGVWFLLAAVMILVYDATLSLGANGTFASTALSELWRTLSPASLNAAKSQVLALAPPYLWNVVIVAILARSAWVVAAVLGVLLYWLGRKRNRINIYAN